MGDDEEEILSEVKRDYVRSLAKDGERIDGRGFDDYRDIQITTNVSTRAEGSARVKIGDTEVMVGVKAQVGDPFDDRPEKGVIITTAELAAISSPAFESGPPRGPAIELARVVDRGIRETEVVDLDNLNIEGVEEYEDNVWVIFIDIHVLDYDGNLIDAASIGALTALATGMLPKERNDLGEDVPIPVEQFPVTMTATKLDDDAIVLDPSLTEDVVGRPRLTVSLDENGDIRAMQKGLPGGLTRDEIDNIIKMVRDNEGPIRKQIMESIDVGKK